MVPVLVLWLLSGVAGTVGAELDPKLRREVEARIDVVHRWSADATIVEAVRVANSNLRPLEDIHELDREWQAAAGVSDFIRAVMENPVGVRLRELRASNPELQEAFVTDKLGANVGSTNKTSDFFQGDEVTFLEAFANGEGGVHVGGVYRDESIQAFSVQIALPVVNDGQAIGVLVVTVNLEKLKRTMNGRYDEGLR